jgi:hypothetical protein
LEDIDTYFSVIFYNAEAAWVAESEFTKDGDQTGYTWLETEVKTIKCPENRFGNDTVGRGANLTTNYCP